jgi:hydroxymethylpyrimidine pyrophosphatase-like HAD family hydrolase
MKSYLIILVCFFLAFCNSKNQETVTEKALENKNVKAKANYSNKVFFEFNKVDHFHLKIDRNTTIAIFRNKKQTETEKELSNVLSGFFPKTINESEFESILLKLKFKKTEVDSSKLEEFRRIFSEKSPNENYSLSSSIPTYCDIFIFKMNEKTTGIAEISFENHLNRILGTDKKTEHFGQNGNMEKLQNLVK